jgi:hypothetical protein
MRASIQLYTENPLASSSDAILKCLSHVAPEGPFYVSRTIGPANYFTLETEVSGDGELEVITFPPKDMSREKIDSVSKLPQFYRDGSVLTISPSIRNSPKLLSLYSEIESEPHHGEGFNQTRMIFGPSDIVDYDLDDTPRLHAVSEFAFVISWDMYRSDFVGFSEKFKTSKTLNNFKSELEEILGDLHLFISY